MKKKIIVLLTIISLLSVAYAKDLDIKLVIDGEKIENKDGSHFILKNDRILLDKELLVQKLNLDSEIDRDSIILKQNNNTIKLKNDSDIYYFNDKKYEMESEVVKESGVYYIPLRLISEAFNKEVKWDQSTSTAYIMDKEAEVEEFIIKKDSNIGKIIFKALDYHKNSRDLKSKDIRNIKNSNLYYIADLDEDGYVNKKVEISLINNKVSRFRYKDYQNLYSNKRPIISAKDAKSLASRFIKDILGEEVSLIYSPKSNSSLSDPGRVEFFQSSDESIIVGVDRRENMVIFLEKN